MNYILYGTNAYLKSEKINSLISSFFNNDEEQNIIKIDFLNEGVAEIISSLSQSGLSFFNKKVVLVDNSTFLSEEKTRLAMKDEDLNNLLSLLKEIDEETLTIFLVDKETLLKRSKIVKEIEQNGKVLVFNELKRNEYLSYVKKIIVNNGYSISEDALNLLILKIGNNLYSLNNELNKLFLYLEERKYINKDDINEIISSNIEDNVFLLNDAILANDKTKMFKVYNDLRLINVEVVTLINILTTNFIFYDELLYLYNKGYQNDEIALELKAHPFRVKMALEGLYRVKKEKIKDILNKLHILDKKIKNSEIDRFFGFEMFMTSL